MRSSVRRSVISEAIAAAIAVGCGGRIELTAVEEPDATTCGEACAPGPAPTPPKTTGCLRNGLAPPPPCKTGADDRTKDPWVICSASCDAAWISETSTSAPPTGIYHATRICNALGYERLAAYGGTCGSTCGRCQSTPTSCSAPGPMIFDHEGEASDRFGVTLNGNVHWLCAR